jgi:Txe/YoeB family toxin of Txe-Axe toxin-antitoxin module
MLKQRYDDYISKDSQISFIISKIVIKKFKKIISNIYNDPLKFYDTLHKLKKDTIKYQILNISQQISLLSQNLIKFNLTILQLIIKERITGIQIPKIKPIIKDVLTSFQITYSKKSFVFPKPSKNLIDLENSPTIPFILIDETEESLKTRIRKYFGCKLIYKNHVTKFVQDQLYYIKKYKNYEKNESFVNIEKKELDEKFGEFFENYYNKNNTIDDRFGLLDVHEKLRNKEAFLY